MVPVLHWGRSLAFRRDELTTTELRETALSTGHGGSEGSLLSRIKLA